MKIILRILFWGLLATVGALVIISAILFLPVISDPTTKINLRRGEIVEVISTKVWQEQQSRYNELSLVSSSGLRVDLTVRVPLKAVSPRPLVILLGGIRTGRKAAQLLPDTKGVVVAALSYPYYGDHVLEGVKLLVNIPNVQQALIDVAPAILLVLDYLIEQPYVDAKNIELVGVSLGAFFVSLPGAHEQKIKRVWLVHGAGDPEAIFDYRLEGRIESKLIRKFTAKLLATLCYSHYLRPERWTSQISPRPVIVINSRHDDAFPPSSIAALHGSLQQPTEIIWTEGGHIRASHKAIVQQISTLIINRVAEGK